MSRSWALRSLLGRGTSLWLKATSEPMYRPLTHHAAHAQRWLCCVLISVGLKWSWQSSIYKVIWAHRIQSLLFLWSGVWISSRVSLFFLLLPLFAAILSFVLLVHTPSYLVFICNYTQWFFFYVHSKSNDKERLFIHIFFIPLLKLAHALDRQEE